MSRVLLADSSSDGEGGYQHGRFARSGDDDGDRQATRRWCRPAVLACCAAAPLALVSIAALIGHVRLQHGRPQRSLGGRLSIIDANTDDEKGSLLPASGDSVQRLRGPQGGHMSPPSLGAPVELPMAEAYDASMSMANDSATNTSASGNATAEGMNGTADAAAEDSDVTSFPAVPAMAALEVTTPAMPIATTPAMPMATTPAMPMATSSLLWAAAGMSDLSTTPAPAANETANETSSNDSSTTAAAVGTDADMEKPVEQVAAYYNMSSSPVVDSNSSSNDSAETAAMSSSMFGTASVATATAGKEVPSEEAATAAPEEGTPAKSFFKMPKVAGAEAVAEDAQKQASAVQKKATEAMDGLAGVSGSIGALGEVVKTEATKEVASDHSVADLQAADGVMKKLGNMANASGTVSGDTASVAAVQQAAQAVLANEGSLVKAANDTTGGQLGKITESIDANGAKVAAGLTKVEDEAMQVAPGLQDMAAQATGGVSVPGEVQDTLKPVAGEAAQAKELGEAAAAKVQEGGSPLDMLHGEAVKDAASVDSVKQIAASAEGNVEVAAKLGQEMIGPEDMAKMEDAAADDAFQVGDTLGSVAEGVQDGQVPNLDDAKAAAGPAATMVAGQVPPDVVEKVGAAEKQVEAAAKTAEAASDEAQAAVIQVTSAEKEVEAATDKVPDDVKEQIDSIEKRAKEVIPNDVEKSASKPKDIWSKIKSWR